MLLEHSRVIYLIKFMVNYGQLNFFTETAFFSSLINSDYLPCAGLGLMSEISVYMGFRFVPNIK